MLRILSCLGLCAIICGCNDPKTLEPYGLSIGSRVIVQRGDGRSQSARDHDGKEGTLVKMSCNEPVVRFDNGGESMISPQYLKKIGPADPMEKAKTPEEVLKAIPGAWKDKPDQTNVRERFHLGSIVKITLTGQKAQVLEVKESFTQDKDRKHRDYKIRVSDTLQVIDASDFELEP